MENTVNEEVKKLTLRELAFLHAQEYPEQVPAVLESYLEELNEEKRLALTLKLKNEKYKESFNEAISFTAFTVFILLKKVLGVEDDYNVYLKEYVLASRYDDADIQDMRLNFLGLYTEKEVAVNLLGLSEEIADGFNREIAEFTGKFKVIKGIV